MSGHYSGNKNSKQTVITDFLFPLYYKTEATFGDKYLSVYSNDSSEKGIQSYLFPISYFQIDKVKEYSSKYEDGSHKSFLKTYNRCGNQNGYKCCGNDCKYYTKIEKKDFPYKWVKYSGNGELPSGLI